MKVIILEGSSASGKTTTAKKLAEKFKEKGLSCNIVGENQTLMPILNNRNNDVSKSHLFKITKEAFKKNCDFTIFDRLHLTSSAITKTKLDKYSDFEELLLTKESLLVLLRMDESIIPKRIFDSINYRSPSWGEYVRKKGSKKDINRHYIEAQRKVEKQFKETKLPKIMLDTTNAEFQKIADQIIDRIFGD